MSLIDARVWSAVAAAVLIGCSTATAPADKTETKVSLITIGPPVTTVDTTGSTICSRSVGAFHTRCTPTALTDTVSCPTFSPQPASAAVGESVQWFNNSGADVTLFQEPGHSPIVTISAGLTSSGVFWSQAGTITYAGSSCTTSGYRGNWTPPLETIYITAGS